MKFVNLLSVLIGATMTGLLGSSPTQAALLIDQQSVVVNSDTQEALFTINFNEVPDFFSVDEFGRQADSFQYYIDPDSRFPVPFGEGREVIIRGEEIHVSSNNIRVRDVFGNGGPNSGGWGPIRGSVPFSLNGSTLTFSSPLELIGDSDGRFSYRLELYEFGGTTDSVQSRVPVPEPSLALGVLTSGVLGGSLLKRKLKHNC